MVGSRNISADCERFEGELSAFMEGETRPYVIAHAHDCTACGAVLADLQAIRQAARELPEMEPPHLDWAGVRVKLQVAGAFKPSPCAQFDAELAAFLEGEAGSLVADHAQDCAACGAVLADLQAIRAAARDLPQVEPPHLGWAGVRASLEAEGVFASRACHQFGAELAAYLDGEARPFVLSHAQACGPCGAMLADLESIRKVARELSLEEPPQELWLKLRTVLVEAGAFGDTAGFGQSVDRKRSLGQIVTNWRRILSWRLVPQLVPLGVLTSLVILGSVLTLPPGSLQRRAGTHQVADFAEMSQIASVTPTAEDKALARVVSEMERSFKASETSMTPDLKATYDKSLVSLDGSIRECLDSLQQEPGNTLTREYLLAAYTSKAEVLSSALEFQGR